MPVVKPRKVGSSEVFTIPKGIKITHDQYEVFSGHDGAIIFLPKNKNPFTDPAFIKAHRNDLTDDDFFQIRLLKNEF